MICFVGLIIFAFLGIFSAVYRQYALEALQCIKNRAQRNPCETGFDEKYRAWSIDLAMKLHPGIARFVNRYFKAINWFLLLLTVLLTVDVAQSLYNLYIYGTCNPGGACSIEHFLWLMERRWETLVP
ncbi:hypothetical protein ACK3SF_01660 [Candidatus Nanosalina sp. VS9-1]|uniref:hypothetical protein n=1 Tax=Candidatus Nanosalina sp. VS9-1 TaxID=3388566 RepID=UPI0039DF9636